MAWDCKKKYREDPEWAEKIRQKQRDRRLEIKINDPVRYELVLLRAKKYEIHQRIEAAQDRIERNEKKLLLVCKEIARLEKLQHGRVRR